MADVLDGWQGTALFLSARNHSMGLFPSQARQRPSSSLVLDQVIPLFSHPHHTALIKLAVIAFPDKLVPAPVLELIPPPAEVRIPCIFLGNVDRAQTEMMKTAAEAHGPTVVRCVLISPRHSFGLVHQHIRFSDANPLSDRRTSTYDQLKQSDPIVYARTGKELASFHAHRYPLHLLHTHAPGYQGWAVALQSFLPFALASGAEARQSLSQAMTAHAPCSCSWVSRS